MEIELKLSGVTATKDDARAIAEIVRNAANTVGVPLDSIREVVVATEDQFGEVVGRFDPTKRYTNSRGLVAAGKVFTHRAANPMTHSILLQHSVAHGFLNAPKEHGKDYHAWPGEAQRNLYVLYHELGHCRDHMERSLDLDDGTFRDEAGRRVVDSTYANICKCHHSILLDELVACANSGMAFTEKTRLLDCRMNNEFVETQLEIVCDMTFETSPDLNKIREEAIGLLWFILKQQAKHTGSWLGNASLSDAAPEDLWTLAKSAKPVADALRKADSAMQSAWETYPNFTSEFRNEMTCCVDALAQYCGFEFTRNERNGVWWDSPKNLSVVKLLVARRIPPTWKGIRDSR